MDLEGIMLSKISQTKLNTVLFHLYVGSKNKTNGQTKQNKNPDTENKEVFATEVEGGGWVKWVKVIKGINLQL